MHLGVDDLNVVSQVGQIIDGRRAKLPFELLVDGDLYTLIREMNRVRGPGVFA